MAQFPSRIVKRNTHTKSSKPYARAPNLVQKVKDAVSSTWSWIAGFKEDTEETSSSKSEMKAPLILHNRRNKPERKLSIDEALNIIEKEPIIAQSSPKVEIKKESTVAPTSMPISIERKNMLKLTFSELAIYFKQKGSSPMTSEEYERLETIIRSCGEKKMKFTELVNEERKRKLKQSRFEKKPDIQFDWHPPNEPVKESMVQAPVETKKGPAKFSAKFEESDEEMEEKVEIPSKINWEFENSKKISTCIQTEEPESVSSKKEEERKKDVFIPTQPEMQFQAPLQEKKAESSNLKHEEKREVSSLTEKKETNATFNFMEKNEAHLPFNFMDKKEAPAEFLFTEKKDAPPVFSISGARTVDSGKADIAPSFSFAPAVEKKKEEIPVFSFAPKESITKEEAAPFSFNFNSGNSIDSTKITKEEIKVEPPLPFSFPTAVSSGMSKRDLDEEKGKDSFTPPFSFGSSSSQQPSISSQVKVDDAVQKKPIFSFGEIKSDSVEKPLNQPVEQSAPPFVFGAKSDSTNAKPMFSLGGEDKKESTAPFSFGASSLNQGKSEVSLDQGKESELLGASSFSTGTAQKTSFSFGSSSAQPAFSSNSLSGTSGQFTFAPSSQNTAPVQSSSNSSNQPVLATSSQPNFGSSSQPAFGGSNQSAFGSSNQFKFSSSTPSAFGSSQTPTLTSSQPSLNAAPSFNSSSMQHQTPAFTFGSSQPAPQPSFNFGNSSAPSFTFGSSSNATTSAPFQFGSSNQSGSFQFGSGNPTPQLDSSASTPSNFAFNVGSIPDSPKGMEKRRMAVRRKR